MEFLKWVAAILLIIMAATWAAISIRMGVMISVSNEFLAVAGALVSIVSGQGIQGILANKFGAGK